MYIENVLDVLVQLMKNGGKNRGVPRLNTSFGKAQIMALINCAVTGEPKKTMLFYTNL